MAGAFEGIRVTGYRELVRACSASERNVRLGVRAKLREAAEPVREEAERLANGGIKNIGPAWSRFRIGVTTSVVYVAPKSRRHGGTPRKNLAGLLMTKAMEPALEAKAGEVEAMLELALDEIADRNW